MELTGGVPRLITENGTATARDEQRVSCTGKALLGLIAAIDAAADVRGYSHWSLLDHFE